MKKILIFVLLLTTVLAAKSANDPAKVTWDMLKDVSFKKKWYPQESIFMLYPTFGPAIKRLEGKEVTIKGYVIPVDVSTNMYVLSAFPYSMCFFCGGAGPESVISLKPEKNASKKYKTDEMHTFKGVLQLNADDIYEMNYILKDAELAE
jgi:hypothetical protein